MWHVHLAAVCCAVVALFSQGAVVAVAVFLQWWVHWVAGHERHSEVGWCSSLATSEAATLWGQLLQAVYLGPADANRVRGASCCKSCTCICRCLLLKLSRAGGCWYCVLGVGLHRCGASPLCVRHRGNLHPGQSWLAQGFVHTPVTCTRCLYGLLPPYCVLLVFHACRKAGLRCGRVSRVVLGAPWCADHPPVRALAQWPGWQLHVAWLCRCCAGMVCPACGMCRASSGKGDVTHISTFTCMSCSLQGADRHRHVVSFVWKCWRMVRGAVAGLSLVH
jgi:hypothetical protein